MTATVRPSFVLCNRADRPSLIESERRPCSSCAHECLVSPASCDHLVAKIVCVTCALSLGVVDLGVLPGTLAEFAAALRPKDGN